MKNSKAAIVKIAEVNKASVLSKPQKLFNKLTKQIDVKRKRLMDWQALLPEYEKKRINEFEPLVRSFNAYRTEFVHVLDKAFSDKLLNKRERAKIRELVCTIVVELIPENDDETLKKIYNKYSGNDYDTETSESHEVIKAMMESMLDIEIGDDVDFDSPEKMMQQVGEKMQQKFLHEQHVQQEKEASRPKPKQSAKALAKEAKRQEEAENATQSIREIYRKLASALHPDREQNTEERARKTALMQRVNVAYSNKDLLGLLALQLEIEQIDQANINTITDEKLKHYNVILKEQCEELEHEIDAVEMMFKMRCNMSPEDKISPQTAIHDLHADIRAMKRDITMFKRDLASFTDIKQIKSWLKAYQIPSTLAFTEDEIDEMLFNLR